MAGMVRARLVPRKLFWWGMTWPRRLKAVPSAARPCGNEWGVVRQGEGWEDVGACPVKARARPRCCCGL